MDTIRQMLEPFPSKTELFGGGALSPASAELASAFRRGWRAAEDRGPRHVVPFSGIPERWAWARGYDYFRSKERRGFERLKLMGPRLVFVIIRSGWEILEAQAYCRRNGNANSDWTLDWIMAKLHMMLEVEESGSGAR